MLTIERLSIEDTKLLIDGARAKAIEETSRCASR